MHGQTDQPTYSQGASASASASASAGDAKNLNLKIWKPPAHDQTGGAGALRHKESPSNTFIRHKVWEYWSDVWDVSGMYLIVYRVQKKQVL